MTPTRGAVAELSLEDLISNMIDMGRCGLLRITDASATSGCSASATSSQLPTTLRPTATAALSEPGQLVVYQTPAVLERAVAAFVEYFNYLR